MTRTARTNTYRAEFQRTPNNQNAAWFLDLDSAGRLDLDSPYQRRSIWNLEYRQFFIDSVIRNYPTASIFLEPVVQPPKPTVYRVIDGKQRLTAIIDFAQDMFPTSDGLEDANLEGRYFSDLPEDVQVAIYSYKLTVEEVEETSPAELNGYIVGCATTVDLRIIGAVVDYELTD